MMRVAAWATLALGLAACSAPAPTEQSSSEKPVDMVPPVIAKPLPAPAAIDVAKTALAAEPKIKDLTYNERDAVQWHIGVRDDGSSRVGYAEYVCEVLRQKNALAGRTHVRVVDIAKVTQGSDFRSASLGHVICETGDIVAP